MTKTSTRRPAAALRRSLLENLEARQLMAVTSGAINFQPGGPGTPAGMTADYGSAYGWQFGKQYGFSSNNRSNAVERKTSADTEHDTFVKLGSGAAAKWEIAVANGTYSVKVLAGDASAYDSKYVINAENTTVVNGTPTSSSRWVQGTATVTVTDGRLTLTPGAGAYNVKLGSLRFSKTTATPTTPAKPTTPTTPTTSAKVTSPGTLVAAAASSTSVKLTWANPANESGVTVERSTDGAKWADVAWYGANATSHTDTGLTAGKTYYFRVRAWNNAGFARSTVAKVTLTGSTPAPVTPSKPTTPTVTKPAAPAGTKVTLASKNSVKLTWGNVSNETGFIIEKSTNNSTWTEATRVGKDALSATLSGLLYNTTYSFRVKAYNTAGSSAVSNTASIKTGTQTASGAGDEDENETPTTPPPTSGDNINSFVMSGIVQNEAEFNMANKAMKELGIKSVRLWYSVGSWTGALNTWALNKVHQYKAAGYTVTLAVVAKKPTDYNTAKNYFERLIDAPGAKGSVDYWELGNEVNHSPYWSGSLQQYVNTYQKPGWDVLHGEGEKVIGAGVTWDVNALKSLISYGYLDYCDYAGFHPYGENGSIVAQRTLAAKAAVGNKPLIITEWNIRLMTDMNKWASELNIAAKAMSSSCYLSYYYALEVDTSVISTGKGGVVYSNGTRNTPFWNTVYNWTH